MPNVLIRDVDPQVHATLVARAAREGRSLQQYLSEQLSRLAARPSAAELFAEIETRTDLVELTTEEILDTIQAERERRG